MITDDSGEVISRRDFMPFGEELGVGVGGRTENLKYSYLGTDRVRQRFTGYEKDDETGLDFAEARMYQNKHGRFTAPDPLLASASATNPQTFNRYIYTGNNPVNYTDPSGLTFCKSNSTGMIGWNGEIGKPCGDGFSPVDDKEITLGNRSGGNDSHGNKITPGSTVRFNADGTTRVVRTSAQNQAIAQGQSVEAASGDTPGQTAAEAAASGASGSSSGNPDETSSTGSGGVSDVLGLGSCAGLVCEIPVRKEPMPAIDLQGLKTVEGIARGFEACTLVPGLGSACGIGAAIVRGGQGDLGGVGDNLLNAVPFVGWLRKADKAGDIFRGGRFGDLPTGGNIHRHHMPADASTTISRNNGPAIQMEIADHKATKSYGSPKYVAHLKTMINEGQMRQAMYLEIKDVRRIGGTQIQPSNVRNARLCETERNP